MFSDMSDTYTDMAALAEYIAAKEQHGSRYKDEAEAADVLEEEIKEVAAEADYMSGIILYGLRDIDAIEYHARCCLKESAQVLAVIRKWKDTTKS